MDPFDRARAYVAKIPPAISGQGGHSRTFHVACVLMHGFTLDIEEAVTVFQEYNHRCEPPWKDSQLRHKLLDALKTPSSRPQGYLLKASGYVPGIVRPAVGYTSTRGADSQGDSDFIPLEELIVVGCPEQSDDGLCEEEIDEETGYPIIDGVIIPF